MTQCLLGLVTLHFQRFIACVQKYIKKPQNKSYSTRQPLLELSEKGYMFSIFRLSESWINVCTHLVSSRLLFFIILRIY